MHTLEVYLHKQSILQSYISEPPSGLLSFIIIIPAYNEDKLIATLQSLTECSRPSGAIEVIIVFNSSITDNENIRNKNQSVFEIVNKWKKEKSEDHFRIYPILIENLPKKHAGAGFARKIGMDEAIHRFMNINKSDGWILSLDADSLVSNNYFTAIEAAINSNTTAGGCLLPFCHALEGEDFPKEVYIAITQYELHLRYYRHILEYTGFPYAKYTLGSCFGVRADVYAESGGMNRKQAGEDFYFLNKLFPHYPFIEIKDACVYPSSRPSLRVPFGTGPMIHELSQNPGSNLKTYHPEAFIGLKKFFEGVQHFSMMNTKQMLEYISNQESAIQTYLTENNFIEKHLEIKNNTTTQNAYTKRFYTWFDGFRVVKCLNFKHAGFLQKIPVQQAAIEYLKMVNLKTKSAEAWDLLIQFRKMDNID